MQTPAWNDRSRRHDCLGRAVRPVAERVWAEVVVEADRFLEVVAMAGL
jgi:hypothetical protein